MLKLTTGMADACEAESLNAQANEAYKAGLLDAAVELYSKAISCDPSNPKYPCNRAAAYLQLR